MPTWLLFTLLGGLLANGTTITNRFGLKNNGDATAYGWWFEVIRTLIFVFILPFDFTFHYSPKNIITLVLLGFLELVSVYVFMKMFAHSELSVSTLISRLRLIWAPLFAALFLGEILSLHQYLGIALIFAGALATTSIKQIKLDPGVRYSFAFAIMSGLLSIAMKNAVEVGSTSLVMIASAIPAILFLPLIMKNAQNRIVTTIRKTYKHSLLTSIFNVACMYFYLEALRLAQVGQVFAIFNSMAIFAVLAGIFWLHERDHIPQKIIGSIVSILGILLLA